ncbi:MAG: hypothetical protein ACJA2M_002656 [Polaribacter sp.]|jgi:hypothetical protein
MLAKLRAQSVLINVDLEMFYKDPVSNHRYFVRDKARNEILDRIELRVCSKSQNQVFFVSAVSVKIKIVDFKGILCCLKKKFSFV